MNFKDERRKALPRAKSNSGFTLIEVLIAMTLLSIMVVLLFSSMRICAQSWEKGENKITDVNEVAVVYNFFQRHLSLAIPLSNDALAQGNVNAAGQPQAAENGSKTLSFQGKKQFLQFVSVFPASAGRSGMQLFSIRPQQQDGEQVINVTLTPFFPTAEGEEWRPEEVVLLRHVSDFTLAYFGKAEGESASSWHDEWLEKDVLPQLVKVSISTANGVFWPEMIIALKASGAGSTTLGVGNNPNMPGLTGGGN
jgi:general secretion pathway protein J